MNIDVNHRVLGTCILTTNHADSSMGMPVLLTRGGVVFGPEDVPPGDLREPAGCTWTSEERQEMQNVSRQSRMIGYRIKL